MPAPPSPARAEVWLANLDPPTGHEQGGTRPVLVVSVDPFNRSRLGLVIVVPLTSQQKGFPTHVEMQPPEGGLKRLSWAKCEDVRSISTRRLVRRLGYATPRTRAAVDELLRKVLGL